jgi:hypothetical protein
MNRWNGQRRSPIGTEVTGGAGYIGGQVVHELADAGQ